MNEPVVTIDRPQVTCHGPYEGYHWPDIYEATISWSGIARRRNVSSGRATLPRSKHRAAPVLAAPTAIEWDTGLPFSSNPPSPERPSEPQPSPPGQPTISL
ncbi:hypothetical protein PtA15_9A402 [Puccinia triticina]|uniref:Uncharacterized protein n=1 Tax=Puccinia triticina TaxID=208348 RepID=A0ABY7CUD3_9BASI|nr:uncharacterized protein PtA15_9A402 [Puccinia triticina]WAQ88275.1 hypothetical protein PtA15_9A402 [Puccinia triticina]